MSRSERWPAFFDMIVAGTTGLLSAVMLVGDRETLATKRRRRETQRQERETQRRRSCLPVFAAGFDQGSFTALALRVQRNIPRVAGLQVNGLFIIIWVRSNSGATTWTAELDFNDYGRLTGAYSIRSENPNSIIPRQFADSVCAEIRHHLRWPGW